jgi:hypothetical protein
VVVSDDAGFPGDDGEDDGDRHSEGNSSAWTRRSKASWSIEDVRLEELRVATASQREGCVLLEPLEINGEVREKRKEEGIYWHHKGVAGSPFSARIERGQWQYWRAPVNEFAAACWCSGLGSGGKWRGARGFLIGADMASYNGRNRRELTPEEITARGATGVISVRGRRQ